MSDKIGQEGYKLESEENLKLLASQLALNHFNRAAIDFYKNQQTESDNLEADKQKLVEKQEEYNNQIDKIKNEVFDFSKIKKDANEEIIKSFYDNNIYRNILVIGAGATFNAFQKLSIADTAISDIQEKIVLGNIKIRGKPKPLSFDYFITFYQYFKSEFESDLSLDDLKKKLKYDVLNSYLSEELKVDKKVLENLGIPLLPKQPEDLETKNDNEETISALDEIGKKYFREYDRLKLHSSEDDTAKKRDFETSLHLLSEMFSVTTIRKLIQEIYNYRHGPILSYEIIAHLFKNGFIDVIVNFNFDELLDQAIDDEMHRDGYDLILSDGDCKSFSELAFNGRLRQPLYIKPHGTASHKSSMRFTKNQYYELPLDMRILLEEMMSGKIIKDHPAEVDQKVKIILTTVGFGMQSLEFNDIIAKNFPEGSKIFDFYYFDKENEENKTEKDIIDSEESKLVKIFKKRDAPIEKEDFRFIGTENFKDFEEVWKGNDMTSIGHAFYKLFTLVQSYFEPKFKPSDINRHLLVTKIFGNKKFWDELKSDNKYGSFFLETYFNRCDYYKDRLMLEIVINLVSNNGKLDLSILMKGNAGYYYSLYFDSYKGSDKRTLTDFIAAIDIIEGNVINPLETWGLKSRDNLDKIIENFLCGDNSCLSDVLKKYLKQLKSYETSESQKLKSYFDKLTNTNSSRIESKLRSSRHHIFQDYKKTDLITSNLSYKLNFYNGITNFFNEINIDSSEKENFKPNTMCVIADYGYLLKHFIIDIIKSELIENVYLILCWPEPIEMDDINKDEDENIQGFKNVYDRSISRLTFFGEDDIEKLAELEPLLKINLDKETHDILVKKTQAKIIKSFKKKAHIIFRPVKRHNHHMIVFTNVNGKTISSDKLTGKAIYYHKKGLSENINPIFIKEETNVKYLLEKFGYYYRKAKEELGVVKEEKQKWKDLNIWIKSINE
nr:SIR2 family protein [uncultured Psychroserpens sp.]